MSWMTWMLFVGLLYSVCILADGKHKCREAKLKDCLTNRKKATYFVVADKFDGFIDANKWRIPLSTEIGCIIFLQKNATKPKKCQRWPQMERNGSHFLISKWHIEKKLHLYVLQGKQCNSTIYGLNDSCIFNHNLNHNLSQKGSCQIRCLDTETICKESSYDNNCDKQAPQIKDMYIININAKNTNCFNCDNPVKKPEERIKLNTTTITEGEKVNAVQAAAVMNDMAELATSISGSSAAVTVAEGVTGILVTSDPLDLDTVLFAYGSSDDSLNIVDNKTTQAQFSRSVTVSQDAFEKAVSMNVSIPFAAVFRFINLTSDEMNSTVLGNEVLAVEMGAMIENLTDKLIINFRNMEYEGIPSCHSWNGEGSQPNWTDDGCLTIKSGDNITCECSHLTFFAILLTPLNETISSFDLNNLTIITQAGCGLSMFFLSIVFVMHFLLRKTKASVATRILIHLISAMFLLNFTFLINNFVAKMKSSVGCKIMAALMHYFMLATFTWFAVQAFHLCLQLYMGGKIVIRHYILKVSIISWVLPSVVGIVLLILGKYGEQVIYTSDSEENVAMCWITDGDVHYIVNIGYYALVFLFTFTTFIIILSWLFCLKRMKTGKGNEEISTKGKSIGIILALCCILGITWGFAFFAYGPLRIPGYYIFTALNSFQGFFLFIYYYKTRHSGEEADGASGIKSSISTLDTYLNPYTGTPKTEIKPNGD